MDRSGLAPSGGLLLAGPLPDCCGAQQGEFLGQVASSELLLASFMFVNASHSFFTLPPAAGRHTRGRGAHPPCTGVEAVSFHSSIAAATAVKSRRPPWAIPACPSLLAVSCGFGSRGAKARRGRFRPELCRTRVDLCVVVARGPSVLEVLLHKSAFLMSGTLAYIDGGGSAAVSLLGQAVEVEEQVKLLRQKVLDVYGSTGVMEASQLNIWPSDIRDCRSFTGTFASSLSAKASLLLPRGRLLRLGQPPEAAHVPGSC